VNACSVNTVLSDGSFNNANPGGGAVHTRPASGRVARSFRKASPGRAGPGKVALGRAFPGRPKKPLASRRGTRGGTRSTQRGVALITILFIVVVATVLGVTMARDQHQSIHRTRNALEQGQLKQFALGGEELARQILYEDFSENPNKDHLAETWASPELQFEHPDGLVELQIEDLQGRFNLNSLMDLTTSRGRQQQTRFVALLTTLAIDPVVGARIGDWVDPDQVVRSAGAEDYAYLGLAQPYRTGGQPMVDVSEMRAVLEMDPERYALLEREVAAVADPRAALNVNTASAVVLQAMIPSLTLEMAEGVVAMRDEQEGFDQVSAFLAAAGSPPGSAAALVGLGVQSSFFRVTVRATLQDRVGYLTSVIQRSPIDGSMHVIYRDFTKRFQPRVQEVDPGDNPGLTNV
jgi:general secretion pathway protein K